MMALPITPMCDRYGPDSEHTATLAAVILEGSHE